MKILNQKTIILNHLESQVTQRLLHSKTDGLVQLLSDNDCAAIFSVLEYSNIYFNFKLELVKNGFTSQRLERIHKLVIEISESTNDVELRFLRELAKVFEILSKDFSSHVNSIKAISSSEMEQSIEVAKKDSHVFANELADFQDAKKSFDELRQIIKTTDLTKAEYLLPFSKKLFKCFNANPPFVVFEFCENELPNIPLKMIIGLLSSMDVCGYEPIIGQYLTVSGSLYREKTIDIEEYKCRLISAYGSLMLFSGVNRLSIEEMLNVVLHGVMDETRSKVA